ncbi:MAG TPA: LLM class F420-dependent oxidoreductase [Acidimicrobiaceae bacterium]|nr:LLM class F420-dependent oxidoreductase [Acidimicrobiaceae bacterium]
MLSAANRSDFLETVRRIEGHGYSTVFCPDHLNEQFAPTVAITVAAEATTTLKVGAFVYCVDYRHPMVLAKEFATLDLLTEGRAEFGMGAGWMRSDYDASGIAYDRPGVRIARLAEAVQIVRGLWSGRPFDFDGEHYSITGAVGSPTPHTPGGPPVIIGGGGKVVLSVAARHADIVGFNPSLHEGVVGQGAARSAVASEFAKRRQWVADAAGDRFDQIELQLNTFMAVVTDDRDSLFEQLASGFGLTPAEAAESPIVLAGTTAQICEQLQHHREVYGTSYIVVHEPEVDAFAPVVAQLAGT